MLSCLSGTILTATLSWAQVSDAELKKEWALFDGPWVVESLVIDGREENGDAKGATVMFVESKMVIVLKADGKEERKETAMTIDPAKQPKAVDFVIPEDRGKGKALGIYQFTDDLLTICATDPPRSTERPTKFECQAGEKLVAFKLRRAKP